MSSHYILNSIKLFPLKTVPSAESLVYWQINSKVSVFLFNNTNKLIRLRKGSTIGKIETVKECISVNVKGLNQMEQQMPLKLSSLYDLKQKTIVPSDHRETVEDFMEQYVNLFVDKDTDLGRTNTIKISIDTRSHPPVNLRPYRTPFTKHPIYRYGSE